MIEALGPGTRLGYCTNVHAGHDLNATLLNLATHATVVRERLGARELGIGLWLSAAAATTAMGRLAEVRERLAAMGLRVFTLNGFPYDDFHGPVVKHRVYEPSWSDPRRLEYTLRLIEVLHALLPDGEEGSISTLPLGWPGTPCAPVDLGVAAGALHAVASRLAALEAETGRLIHVDIEPEPGCLLQRSADVVRFMQERLFAPGGKVERDAQRYLRVCHDVCHAAVMFEEQRDALDAYARAGIGVGKVQISSALSERGTHAAALRSFAEPRYLHQTCVSRAAGVRAYEDLPAALAAEAPTADAEWRVHFHVPVYLDWIGELGTTRGEIGEAITLAKGMGARHFEVETYAWGVLPPALQRDTLAEGIADELRWVMSGGRP
jgi:hypothetical protein